MNIYQVIIAPVVSEKSVLGQEGGKYQFLIHNQATKTDVKNAIKKIYNIDVLSVNISTRPGKTRAHGRKPSTIRRQERKKAIITVKSGQVLDPGKIYAEYKKEDKKN